MVDLQTVLLAILLGVVLLSLPLYLFGVRRNVKRTLNQARRQAARILEESERDAQNKVREAELAAKEKLLQARSEFDRVAGEERAAIEDKRRKLDQRKSDLERRLADVGRQEKAARGTRTTLKRA